MKTELIELILTDSTAPESQHAEIDPMTRRVVVGTIAELSEAGEPIVSFGHGSKPTVARSTVAITQSEIGKEAVLVFEGGDVHKPIIIGILQHTAPLKREVKLDGERLVLNADKEIVLQCGEASITLTRAGKVLIRGAYLSSRSSGVHRIKGGSVQIN